MDPAAVVVGALCQGAVASLSRGTEAGLVQAYQHLKNLVTKGRRAQVAARQEELARAVEALYEALAKLGVEADDELVRAAQGVSRRYDVTVTNSQGVVVGGEHHTIDMRFGASDVSRDQT